MVCTYITPLSAKESFFVQTCAVYAVLAGSGDALAKQHRICRLSESFLYYTTEDPGMLLQFLRFMRRIAMIAIARMMYNGWM
jgi:hypothetical protein